MSRSNDYWRGYADGLLDAHAPDPDHADDALLDLLDDLLTNPGVAMSPDLSDTVQTIVTYWRDPAP